MEFCFHYIDAAKIIGIGPLIKETARDTAMMHLYGPVRLYFKLFFENYSAEITSDQVYLRSVTDEELRKNTAHLEAFQKGFEDLKAFVIDKISK